MDHIKKVETQPINFSKFKKITPKIYRECQTLAKKLKGKKIIHLNSTQLGGGVSELLRSQVPLEQSLGLDSHWYIIKAPLQFFKVTKKIHNLFQGGSGSLNIVEKYFYLKWLHSQIALSFKEMLAYEKPDIVLIHDPQPLPLIDYFKKNHSPHPILRLHIDLSNPNKSILKFLQPLMKKYELIIFSHPSYRPLWWSNKKTKIITPVIDPFTDKNKFMKKSEAERILNLYQINTDYPIVSQVSRFDPWKDPLGTLKAYYLARNKIPNLQLILAGICWAYDDPEAIKVFKKVEKQAKGDPRVFLFSDPRKLGDVSNDLFINAVYTASTVMIQKSIKEGFGMVVTEAMWKGKAVVGGQTTGIGLQIEHGKNGYLVSSSEEAAKYLIQLLEDKSLRKRLGQAAKETVRNKFLSSRGVLEHLKIYKDL